MTPNLRQPTPDELWAALDAVRRDLAALAETPPGEDRDRREAELCRAEAALVRQIGDATKSEG